MVTDILPRERCNAVTLAELSDRLGISERTVSTLISEARREGVPICSSKNFPCGYWITSRRDELDETAARIQREALCRLETVLSLKKIQLPGEPQQQTIETV